MRIKFDVLPDLVKPKLEDLDAQTIDYPSIVQLPNELIPDFNRATNTSQNSLQQRDSQGYEWISWTLDMRLNNIGKLSDTVKNFLENLNNLNRIIIQVLKILRTFNSDLKSISNLIKFLIKKVADELKQFIESLASTGLYMSVIAPNFDKKFPKYTIPIYGGYQEFIKRVNATCLASSDPDAPRFYDKGDKVGGVIIAMLGGSEDPTFLADMIQNFKILGDLFGFTPPVPSPPKNFKVYPGFFNNPEEGIKNSGIKITWEPAETPASYYRIYRTAHPQGTLKKLEQNGKIIQYRVYPMYNAERRYVEEIKRNPLRLRYTYVDFDVEEGIDYYYQIFSVYGEGDQFFSDNPLLEAMNSPIATPMLRASARNCIPVSELEKYTVLGINGELMLPVDLEGDWQSITVRRLLGSTLDDLFVKIDALADKLTGLVDTSSNAISSYIKFFEKRIKILLNVVDKITEVTERLMNFNLRGTFMVMRLPIEEGGIQNFVERFNQGAQIGNAEQGTAKGPDSPFAVTKGGGIAQYTDKGIMFGIILLFGFPGPGSMSLDALVSEQDRNSFLNSFEDTEKAITTLLQLLGLGD